MGQINDAAAASGNGCTNACLAGCSFMCQAGCALSAFVAEGGALLASAAGGITGGVVTG